VLSLAAALGVVCVLAFGVTWMLGIRPLVVISGSMEPTVPTGSVVFSKMAAVQDVVPGQIVTVARTEAHGLVTHRLVSKTQDDNGIWVLTLKGDANDDVDPQPYQAAEVGLYLWHIPWLGNVALTMQSPEGLLVAVLGALGLLAVYLRDGGTGVQLPRFPKPVLPHFSLPKLPSLPALGLSILPKSLPSRAIRRQPQAVSMSVVPGFRRSPERGNPNPVIQCSPHPAAPAPDTETGLRTSGRKNRNVPKPKWNITA
jgi:signal peptidase